MLSRMSAPLAAAHDHAPKGMVPSGLSLAFLCVLIPAWQPNAALLPLITDLSRRGFGKLLLINDGSTADCDAVFAAAASLPGVEVLRHPVNLGKGRALKTGFEHLLRADNGILGVITADADGQHTPEDIAKVAQALLANGLRTVLGSRGFEQNVPWRSRLGNALTRRVFNLLLGVDLADTQTGLRGLPRVLLPELLALRGERYEYEMTVLAYLCRSRRTPLEVPIATVYLDRNRGSHFRPVWDSVRIYFVLLGLWRVLVAGRR